MPVALDEVAYMFGQFIALHIEPDLNFGSDILRNVLGPMFEGVECDDAKRIVELSLGPSWLEQVRCPYLMLWTAPPPARECHGCERC